MCNIFIYVLLICNIFYYASLKIHYLLLQSNHSLQFLRGLTLKRWPDSALLIDWQPKKPDCLKREDTRSKKNTRNSKYTEIVYERVQKLRPVL